VPVAIYVPSGAKAIEVPPPLWPVSVRTAAEGMFQGQPVRIMHGIDSLPFSYDNTPITGL
jgi:hypothetical protein